MNDEKVIQSVRIDQLPGGHSIDSSTTSEYACSVMAANNGTSRDPRVAVRERSALTARERQVLWLICEGLTNEQIAACLMLSKRTVQTHRVKLRNRLAARNLSQLVRSAVSRWFTRFS